MHQKRSSWIRWLAPGIATLGLILSSAARAQDDEAASTESKGRPLDGYIATTLLSALVFYIIGKSARR
jgi:hypothetical protein